jgi:hypothetical protein
LPSNTYKEEAKVGLNRHKNIMIEEEFEYTPLIPLNHLNEASDD